MYKRNNEFKIRIFTNYTSIINSSEKNYMHAQAIVL